MRASVTDSRRAWAAPEVLVPTLLTGATLVVCAVAFLSQADRTAMWLDELSVRYWFSSRPLAELVSKPVSLSYILCHLFDQWIGTDWGVRLPIVFWSLLVLYCSYSIVAHAGSRVVAWMAMIAVLLMPLYQQYILMNRFYMGGTAMMLASWVVGMWALRQRRALCWLGYAVVAFLSCHVWPWSSIWTGFMSAYFGLRLLEQFVRYQGAPRRWRRFIVSGFLVCLPVIAFGIHFLLAPALDDEVNYGIWNGEFAFDVSYVFKCARESVQGLARHSRQVWAGLFLGSLVLLLLTRRLNMLAFALVTLITWRVVIYVCFDAKADPMPKRIMFVYVNTVIVLFAGYAAGLRWVWEHGWMNWLRRRAWLRWALMTGVAVLSAGYVWRTHGDTLIINYNRLAIDHARYPHRHVAALMHDNVADRAHIVCLENGKGIAWGNQAYFKAHTDRKYLTYKTYWPRSNPNNVTLERVRQRLDKGRQVWLLSEAQDIPADVNAMCASNGVRFPMGYGVWWLEPRFARMTEDEKREVRRAALSEVFDQLEPNDVTSAEIQELIRRLPDEEFDRHMHRIAKRDLRSRDSSYEMAQLFASAGMYEAAMQALRAPLDHRVRSESMYLDLARRAEMLLDDAPETNRATCIAAILDLYSDAARRGSARGRRMLKAWQTRRRIGQGIATNIAARLAHQDGLVLWASFAPDVVVSNRIIARVPAGAELRNEPRALEVTNVVSAAGFHAGSGRAFSYTNEAVRGNDSFTAGVVMRAGNGGRLDVLLGQGTGKGKDGATWFLQDSTSDEHIRLVIQYRTGAQQFDELRLSAPRYPKWTTSYHCVVATYDAGRGKAALYVDGYVLREAPVPGTRLTSENPLTIGSLAGRRFPFHGHIREVFIADGAWDSERIERLCVPDEEEK